jgi:moderate conductance mechanosensitive channel
MRTVSFVSVLSVLSDIAVILLVAVLAHVAVRLFRRLSDLALRAKMPAAGNLQDFYPKYATMITLVISSVTFAIYFLAVGLILREFGVSLTAYFASASIIGLAVGFGSQGLVQDVVTSITLLFAGVLSIGDLVEIGGQVGRVERVGMRFTTLTNFNGQAVYIPNRTIGLINRFPGGLLYAYVDIQAPNGADRERFRERVEGIARGTHRQHGAVVLAAPEVLGFRVAGEGTTGEGAGEGAWTYLRLRFRIWPGQTALIETTFRQRVLAAMKELDPGYGDWMITVVSRVEEEPPPRGRL